jgi:hypothetical protein
VLGVIDIRNCILTDGMVIALGQCCHKLRTLCLSETSVTCEGLKAIAGGCPLLEKFSAWGCDDAGPEVEPVARSCPRLRVVYASVSAEAVVALAEYCPCWKM